MSDLKATRRGVRWTPPPAVELPRYPAAPPTDDRATVVPPAQARGITNGAVQNLEVSADFVPCFEASK